MGEKMFKRIAFLCLITWLPFCTCAQYFDPENWRLWRQSSNIKISYQAALNTDGLAIKAELLVLEQSPENVLKWISQPDFIHQWMVFLKQVETVKVHEQTKLTTLFTFDSVWPLAERQMVLTSEFRFTNGGFEINSTDQQTRYAGLLTETPVSVPYSHWRVSENKSLGQTHIIYTSVTQLNGNAPSALTDKILLRSIWQSFKNLDKAIESD